jgi:hypothetical protein
MEATGLAIILKFYSFREEKHADRKVRVPEYSSHHGRRDCSR